MGAGLPFKNRVSQSLQTKACRSKAAHRKRKENSLPGTDVLAAFVNDGEIQNLVFVEAKLRTARERRIVLQAARQAIADSENGHAPMIAFVLRRLHESDDQMFKPFLNYLARRRGGDQGDLPYVYLVLEQGTWSGNDVSVLDDICPLPPGFRVSVVEIGNLAELVRQSYSWYVNLIL